MSSPSATPAAKAPRRFTFRDRPPPTYDALTTAAPVQPHVFVSESVQGTARSAPLRRYNRVNVQGASANRFDPDQHNATFGYRTRLEAAPLDIDSGYDILLEEERDASIVAQPPEAWASLRSDMRDREFIVILRYQRQIVGLPRLGSSFRPYRLQFLCSLRAIPSSPRRYWQDSFEVIYV